MNHRKPPRISAVLFTILCMICACVQTSCKSSAETQASVALAKATQTMTQGAWIGSRLVFSSQYHERDPNPNAEVGELLYERYCTSCHGNGAKAPPILGVYATNPNSESDFYIIRYGLKEMRGFSTRLTNFQILDILAYLERSKKTGEEE